MLKDIDGGFFVCTNGKQIYILKNKSGTVCASTYINSAETYFEFVLGHVCNNL